MSEAINMQATILSYLEDLKKNQAEYARKQDDLVTAVAKLTAESDRFKEIQSSVLLRKNTVENGSSSSDDVSTSLETHFVKSPGNGSGFKPASVQMYELMNAENEKWAKSLPEEVLFMMEDKEDCLAKLKKFFPELNVLR
jgi:hypothetical protein